VDWLSGTCLRQRPILFSHCAVWEFMSFLHICRFISRKKENNVMENNLILGILLVIIFSLVAFFTREKKQKKAER
jgi:hypothetical protein